MQKLEDKRAEMDMIFTGNDIPDNPELKERNLKSATAIVTSFKVKRKSPNKCRNLIYVEVPTVNGEMEPYSFSDSLEYGSSSPVKLVFENESGEVCNPIGKTLDVHKSDGFWCFKGKTIQSRHSINNYTVSTRERMLETYKETICEKDESKIDSARIKDFYVLESHSNIQQKYTVGLFIELPNGQSKTVEVIHDDDNPSDLLESLVNTSQSLRKQVGDDIPVWYSSETGSWYLLKRDYGFIDRKLMKLGLVSPSEKYMESFGRKYGLAEPEPLPSDISDVQENRIPDLSSLA